jgi:hypothetical protein
VRPEGLGTFKIHLVGVSTSEPVQCEGNVMCFMQQHTAHCVTRFSRFSHGACSSCSNILVYIADTISSNLTQLPQLTVWDLIITDKQKCLIHREENYKEIKHQTFGLVTYMTSKSIVNLLVMQSFITKLNNYESRPALTSTSALVSPLRQHQSTLAVNLKTDDISELLNFVKM